MKRVFDVVVSFVGLLVFSPVLLVVMVLVWLQDFHSPFYIAARVSRGGKLFKMVKLRSMIINADKSGVDSTSGTDPRITSVGNFIRKCKLDEITQLWNVLIGDMSLVGPRPNVKRETDLYTTEEKKLLTVKPGITDFSSIVFSDEGDILAGESDPDLAYNQLIRPWKSRLGIVYVEKRNIVIDIHLVLLTVVSILNRKKAIRMVVALMKKLDVEERLCSVSERQQDLYAFPPPGSNMVVQSR